MGDDEWMAVIGPRDWVVLSQDRKWHVIDAEREAVRQHKLRCIYLPDGDRWELLCLFTRYHGKIIGAVEGKTGPLIIEVKRNGLIREIAL